MQQLQQWAQVPRQQQQKARAVMGETVRRALECAAFEWQLEASELLRRAADLRRKVGS